MNWYDNVRKTHMAVLSKKRDDDYSKANGIKLYPVAEKDFEGKTVVGADFDEVSVFIPMGQLKDLIEGRAKSADGFPSEPFKVRKK